MLAATWRCSLAPALSPLMSTIGISIFAPFCPYDNALLEIIVADLEANLATL